MRNKSHEICQGIVFHCSFVTIYVVNITAIGALRSCCSLADAATRKAAPSHPRPPRPFWAVWPRPWGPCPWSSWWTAWNSWHSPGSRRETEVILWLFGGKRTCLMMEVFFWGEKSSCCWNIWNAFQDLLRLRNSIWKSETNGVLKLGRRAFWTRRRDIFRVLSRGSKFVRPQLQEQTTLDMLLAQLLVLSRRSTMADTYDTTRSTIFQIVFHLLLLIDKLILFNYYFSMDWFLVARTKQSKYDSGQARQQQLQLWRFVWLL